MLAPFALTLALLSSAFPAAAAAQKPTDFSGTWTEDVKARKITPLPGKGPTGMAVIEGPPPQEVITQTAALIRIDRPWLHGVVRHDYRLDGAESVNRNGANTLTTRSRWEAGRLVTEGTSYSETSAGESTWQYTEVRWIDAGGAMVTEVTNIDEAGKRHHVVRVFRKK